MKLAGALEGNCKSRGKRNTTPDHGTRAVSRDLKWSETGVKPPGNLDSTEYILKMIKMVFKVGWIPYFTK